MKTLLKSLLIAFTLTFGSFSVLFAATNLENQPKPEFKVVSYQSSLYTDAEGKLRVSIDKLVGGLVKVQVINSTGKQFFVQRVGRRQKIARIKLNVSQLPDGAYQVLITDGVATKVNNLTLATQQPTFTARMIALN